MSDVQLFSFSVRRGLPRLAAAEGLFLFGIKKTSIASLNAVENIKAYEKQKMPAENFSFEGSCAARTVHPEKFVRPDLSKTGIQCYGSAGWKCESR
jgi:hypothetical protein